MSENIDYEKILIEGNKLKEQITPSRFDLIKGVAFGYCLGRVKVLAINAVNPGASGCINFDTKPFQLNFSPTS